MLTDEQLAAIIEVGYEQRGVEFKSSGNRSDRAFLATVARAVMALANQRDGGYVIIGLSEDGIDASASGLTPEQMGEWLSYDDVSDQINSYADPPVRLEVGRAILPNGRPVAILEVAEFAEVPILSKKDYPQRIVARHLYTRSMAKPESSASVTQNELREVLTLATEKQLARFIETAQRVGVRLGRPEADAAEEQFAAQITGQAGFHLAPTGPWFTTTIRPASFVRRRVQHLDLLPMVRSATVRMRGWPFPWVQAPASGREWVGEQVDGMHPETWQFFESGQFHDVRSIEAFGPDYDGFLGNLEGIAGYLPIWLPLLHFTEVLEFAGRLQRQAFPDETLTVELGLRNILRYALVSGMRGRSGLHGAYVYGDHAWDREVVLSSVDGLVNARELAVEAAMDLLVRFNWRGVTPELLRGIQDEVFGPE